MKAKRILSLFLALLTATGSLAACAATQDDPEKTDGVTTEAVSEADTFLQDNLPDDLDLGKATVKFYGFSGTRIGASNLTGDPVSDAIFERNRKIESEYGIEFQCDTSDITANYVTSLT